MKILGNKSYIVYNKKDWQKLLLILDPYLTVKFTSNLIFDINFKVPLYIRIKLNINNELEYSGWGELQDYKYYNDHCLITKIDCYCGLEKWITRL